MKLKFYQILNSTIFAFLCFNCAGNLFYLTMNRAALFLEGLFDRKYLLFKNLQFVELPCIHDSFTVILLVPVRISIPPLLVAVFDLTEDVILGLNEAVNYHGLQIGLSQTIS